jgi:multiple sugar transport system substrate-binding protein
MAVLVACGAPAATPAASGQAGSPAATPAAGAATPAAGAPAKAAAGTMAVWQVKLFTQSANDLSRKQITDFVQGRGGQVEVSDLPTDFIAKIIPAIEAGDVPDLVQTSSEIAQLRATGGLADVSETVKELTTASGAPIKLLERAGLYEGKWWGVPWFHYADAWFMRKDVLGAAGLKPEELKTWDQRREAALKVSDPDKQVWGWGMTMKSNTGDGDTSARLHLDTWGATMTDESGQKVILGTTNKEAAVAALEWMAETYKDPKWARMLPPGVMGWSGASNNENYLGGKIAITQNASSVYWAAKNQNSPHYKETHVATLAAGPKASLNGGYPYYHLVMQKAKNRDLAVATGRFMAEDAQAFERMKVAEGQSWPAYQKQVEAQVVKEFAQSDPGYAQLLTNSTDPAGWTVGYPGPMTPAAAAVESQFLRAKAYESVIAGQVSAAQAADELHKAAVEVYKSFGFGQ